MQTYVKTLLSLPRLNSLQPKTLLVLLKGPNTLPFTISLLETKQAVIPFATRAWTIHSLCLAVYSPTTTLCKIYRHTPQELFLRICLTCPKWLTRAQCPRNTWKWCGRCFRSALRKWEKRTISDSPTRIRPFNRLSVDSCSRAKTHSWLSRHRSLPTLSPHQLISILKTSSIDNCLKRRRITRGHRLKITRISYPLTLFKATHQSTMIRAYQESPTKYLSKTLAKKEK